MPLQDKLTVRLEPLVEALGYELVLLEYSPHRGSATLRLYIDAVGGITVDDCERVSREVEGVLDVEDLIPHAYTLEVSSPGLDRPLVKPEDFVRFEGREAKVSLLTPLDGRRRFQGVLRGFEGGHVRLFTDAGLVELPMTEIERARLVPRIEF